MPKVERRCGQRRLLSSQGRQGVDRPTWLHKLDFLKLFEVLSFRVSISALIFVFIYLGSCGGDHSVS